MEYQGVSLEELRELPPHEFRKALEVLVAEEFKSALYMEEDEDLPLDVGFFDLGLTSLRLSDIKQTLETRVGQEIDIAVLFRRPTVGQLIDYLAETS
ncbi:acyl carrier protein [Streptomyces triculaminicus]|uniref:Acyl carrier protein n=1 Tax=Streptomyces triculaminicus TaxID=2816232 RepID=A0A939JR67_9ACTN|nr:acyl carrier protein [Streptomyces triculaminicus]MBO0656308.1 acyl carrier protein [Streptomyces triculaminicus]